MCLLPLAVLLDERSARKNLCATRSQAASAAASAASAEPRSAAPEEEEKEAPFTVVASRSGSQTLAGHTATRVSSSTAAAAASGKKERKTAEAGSLVTPQHTPEQVAGAAAAAQPASPPLPPSLPPTPASASAPSSAPASWADLSDSDREDSHMQARPSNPPPSSLSSRPAHTARLLGQAPLCTRRRKRTLRPLRAASSSTPLTGGSNKVERALSFSSPAVASPAAASAAAAASEQSSPPLLRCRQSEECSLLTPLHSCPRPLPLPLALSPPRPSFTFACSHARLGTFNVGLGFERKLPRILTRCSQLMLDAVALQEIGDPALLSTHFPPYFSFTRRDHPLSTQESACCSPCHLLPRSQLPSITNGQADRCCARAQPRTAHPACVSLHALWP